MNVPEAQPGRQRVNSLEIAFAPSFNIVHNLDLPMILHVANRIISVAGHLVAEFCNWSWDWVGVQIS